MGNNFETNKRKYSLIIDVLWYQIVIGELNFLEHEFKKPENNKINFPAEEESIDGNSCIRGTVTPNVSTADDLEILQPSKESEESEEPSDLLGKKRDRKDLGTTEEKDDTPKDKVQIEEKNETPKDKVQIEEKNETPKDKVQIKEKNETPKDKVQIEEKNETPKDKVQKEKKNNIFKTTKKVPKNKGRKKIGENADDDSKTRYHMNNIICKIKRKYIKSIFDLLNKIYKKEYGKNNEKYKKIEEPNSIFKNQIKVEDTNEILDMKLHESFKNKNSIYNSDSLNIKSDNNYTIYSSINDSNFPKTKKILELTFRELFEYFLKDNHEELLKCLEINDEKDYRRIVINNFKLIDDICEEINEKDQDKDIYDPDYYLIIKLVAQDFLIYYDNKKARRRKGEKEEKEEKEEK